MTGGPIVCDSSPIIAFQSIGRLEILQTVFQAVVIPPIVALEIAPSIPERPPWIQLGDDLPIGRTIGVRGLDPGERAAIELALAVDAATLVVDDLAARNWGTRLGLRVTGSVGVAVRAKQQGIVATARPVIDALIESGLYLDRRVYRRALLEAGEPEAPPFPPFPE